MRRVFPFAAVAALVAASPLFAATPALGEVNAARARAGLPPFAEDPALTQAAMRAADYRAAHRIAGHVPGGMGDFAFLPAGASADAAGCGALEPSWGFLSCCLWEPWRYAGAASAVGLDGKVYHHLFVSNRPNVVAAAPCVCGPACVCPGGCPAACPTALTAADAPPDGVHTKTYQDIDAKVARGERCVIAVGVDAPKGAVRFDRLKGLPPGVYDCWREKDGRQVMQVRTAAPALTTFPSACPDGRCPQASPFAPVQR